MACNCRGGPDCCILKYNICRGFIFDETDIYYKPLIDTRKASEALQKAREDRLNRKAKNRRKNG